MRPWLAPVVMVLFGSVPAAPATLADAPASPRPKPTPRPAATRLTPAEAEALVREVSAKVEKIRGMKFKTPVSMKVISGADARADFKAKIPLGAAEDARHTQNAYIHLGLVPPGTDLVTGYLDLAEKDVAGYYEPGSRTFYLLDHVSPDEAEGVMAHELTHALEDQHYDLATIAKRAGNNGDHSTAITAVVEGSAMAVMLAYMGREKGEEKATAELQKTETRRTQRLKVAPSFTQRTLLLPYLLGFSFLLQGKPWEFYLGGGVKATDIDEAYVNTPYSTRQIIHPEQYWMGRARYQQQHLTLPDLSGVIGPGWSKATEGSIGELGLAVLTGSRQPIEVPWALLPGRWTNEAAVGAVGDVYHHYVKDDRSVTVLLTRWETELDANQFAKALLSKGQFFYRYGVNFLVIAGDIGDRAEKVGMAALQGTKFWQ